ncbi:MAG: hypothetical protein AB7G25_17925 [Sphingomonadaceae bacterium]
MTYAPPTLRPGMTALAAALALTSTPLLAQSADMAAPVSPDPVIVSPEQPVEASPSAPNAALNIPSITINMDDAPVASDAASTETSSPAAAPPVTAATPEPSVQRETAETTKPVISAPVDSVPAAAPRAVEAPAPESVLPTPPVAVAVTPAPNVSPAPVITEETVAASDEIALGAGGILGALALIGGAFAFMGRRRRYRDEAVIAATPAEQPEAFVAPAITPRSSAPTATMPSAMLPSGFDMSRYGPHVQAAYRGPTDDNPSLSLSRRLKRARFYDQRARETTMRKPEVGSPHPTQTQAAPQPEYITSHRFSGSRGGFRPAYQG